MGLLLTMEILRVASLLLPFLFHSVFCLPSRPLNERSTELTWQAWLLVDDQNQNKHHDPESFTRRRITPKSVFIAPTFTPESLPACAEDYRPDSMGRCIKIIKLDEEAHSNFLLERLNAQFGNYDEMEEDSQEDLPTAGPFQLNIPLDGDRTEDHDNKGGANDDLDIAIVVAPTNGNFAVEEVETKTKKANVQTQKKSPSLETQLYFGSSSNSKRKIENVHTTTVTQVEEATTTPPTTIETTTLDGTTTIVQSNETDATTTLANSETETATNEILLSTVPQLLDVTETTTPFDEHQQQHALFFLNHSLSNTKHVENGTNNTGEDTPAIAPNNNNHSNIITFDDSLTTLLSNSTMDASVSNKRHTHGDQSGQQVNPSGDLIASEDFLHQSSDNIRFPSGQEEGLSSTRTEYIQFPEEQHTETKFIFPSSDTDTYANQFQYHPSSTNLEHANFPHFDGGHPPKTSDQFGTLLDELLRTRGADLKDADDERFVFKQHDPVAPVAFPPHTATHDRIQFNDGFGVYNHRNRDKHMNLWSVPSSPWSESSPQKPLVFRFSARSGNGKHILEDLILPHAQSSRAIYREVPTREFSYIFGIDSELNQRRRRYHR